MFREIHFDRFNKGKAIIRDYKDGITQCYLINTKGELLFKFPQNVWADNIEDDNVIFANKDINDKFNGEALFSIDGRQLTDFKYRAIYGGSEEGFFEVENIEHKHGHISMTGEEVVPCIYDDGHYFEEGVAEECINGKWGMINWKNETVIPFEYEAISRCNNHNRISAKLNGKWGIIDKFNNKVIDFKYDEICNYLTRDCSSMPAKMGDKWGIIDIYGNTLFDFIYESDSRIKLERHIKRISFLGVKTNIHERIVDTLKMVEEEILELSTKDEEVAGFLKNLKSADAYYWREIEGTKRKSFHSLGIAIDVLPKNLAGKQIFWSWAKDKFPKDWMLVPLKNRWMPPQRVIDIFEKYGFIWGGKWVIYDNMHFEYHPELIKFNFEER